MGGGGLGALPVGIGGAETAGGTLGAFGAPGILTGAGALAAVAGRATAGAAGGAETGRGADTGAGVGVGRGVETGGGVGGALTTAVRIGGGGGGAEGRETGAAGAAGRDGMTTAGAGFAALAASSFSRAMSWADFTIAPLGNFVVKDCGSSVAAGATGGVVADEAAPSETSAGSGSTAVAVFFD